MMTYTFELRLDNISEDKKEETLEKWKGLARMAVDKTISTIREMVKDGRISEK